MSAIDNGAQANSYVHSPTALSTDGRFVIYASLSTNLVAGDTNGFQDIFIRDRLNATTERVSFAFDGSQTNSDNFVPHMTPDVRVITYTSTASNIVANDTNGLIDVFLRRADPADPLGAGDLYPDGFLGDSVLQIFDGANPGPPLTLCPTTLVKVKNGRVVYTLAERPVVESGTAACPAGV